MTGQERPPSRASASPRDREGVAKTKQTTARYAVTWCRSVALSCLTLVTPQTAACQASLSFTISWSLLKLMSTESVMPSNHLILCRPLLLLPSSISSIRVFANESVHSIRWPEYWSFSFSINPSNEYSGLISFRKDWLDLAVQGTLKSLLQRHNSKALILQHSAILYKSLFHYGLLQDIEYSSLCCSVGPCSLLYIWQFVFANPKVLI